MAYNLSIPNRVQKHLDRLPRQEWLRIRTALDRLVDDPRPPGAKSLRGKPNLWRIRAGDYRIVYTIQDDRLIVSSQLQVQRWNLELNNWSLPQPRHAAAASGDRGALL
ncbi:MAG: type II toxin-antitoxin system RelE/ParE family toxin [Magnetococcales bacterium]|nr:type II toxin-antitoxin system RelE/ParE family toxin [Magnetococcales bacterium]